MKNIVISIMVFEVLLLFAGCHYYEAKAPGVRAMYEDGIHVSSEHGPRLVRYEKYDPVTDKWYRAHETQPGVYDWTERGQRERERNLAIQSESTALDNQNNSLEAEGDGPH